jgi:hypothetical protein
MTLKQQWDSEKCHLYVILHKQDGFYVCVMGSSPISNIDLENYLGDKCQLHCKQYSLPKKY